MEEKIWTEEQLEKARNVKSVDELIQLAQTEGFEMSAEEAEELFEILDKKTGELADEELDNVAGGRCKTKVNGKRYTVVSASCQCMYGRYQHLKWQDVYSMGHLRTMWYNAYGKKPCGKCVHLKLKNGIGYCSVS